MAFNVSGPFLDKTRVEVHSHPLISMQYSSAVCRRGVLTPLSFLRHFLDPLATVAAGRGPFPYRAGHCVDLSPELFVVLIHSKCFEGAVCNLLQLFFWS